MLPNRVGHSHLCSYRQRINNKEAAEVRTRDKVVNTIFILGVRARNDGGETATTDTGRVPHRSGCHSDNGVGRVQTQEGEG